MRARIWQGLLISTWMIACGGPPSAADESEADGEVRIGNQTLLRTSKGPSRLEIRFEADASGESFGLQLSRGNETQTIPCSLSGSYDKKPGDSRFAVTCTRSWVVAKTYVSVGVVRTGKLYTMEIVADNTGPLTNDQTKLVRFALGRDFASNEIITSATRARGQVDGTSLSLVTRASSPEKDPVALDAWLESALSPLYGQRVATSGSGAQGTFVASRFDVVPTRTKVSASAMGESTDGRYLARHGIEVDLLSPSGAMISQAAITSAVKTALR